MRCVSTRSAAHVSLCEAISVGLAPDGGLYVPTQIPQATNGDVLQPYFADEVLAPQLDEIARAAFSFDSPLTALGTDTFLLELFHGPTAAFKDFGARFLAECLARLVRPGAHSTVLVATSGDTGAAVASAFHQRPGFRVVVLFPDGRVSARQAHQLSAFGDNVHTFRVQGTFDDCQRMVKGAFSSSALTARHSLTSANSISLGRLLPQATYYAKAAMELAARGAGPMNVVVPTGNLGNALACLLAKRMGLPIGEIVLATNSNRMLCDYLATGDATPRASTPTLANAMDVGAPSNLERLRYWYPDSKHTPLRAQWVSDDEIRQTIRRTFDEHGKIVCPHTACGLEVHRRLRAESAKGTWVIAATAHPAKFETVVEPLINRAVDVPPALAALLSRPATATPLEVSIEALAAALHQLP